MVQFCCVLGCGNRSNREKDKQFFRLPSVPKNCNKSSAKADIIMNRRKQWLMNINREDLKDGGDVAYSAGYIRICSDHFVSGKPSSWMEVSNIDWAPTVMMKYLNPKQKRRIMESLGETNSSMTHPNRWKVHKDTAWRRRLKAEELKRKQKLLKLLLADNVATVDCEGKVEEKLVDRPIIHKITVDSIVKQDRDDLNTAGTEIELSSAEDEGICVRELKYDISEVIESNTNC